MRARIGVETIPLHQYPYFVSPKYQDKRPDPLPSSSLRMSKVYNVALTPGPLLVPSISPSTIESISLSIRPPNEPVGKVTFYDLKAVFRDSVDPSQT